MKKSPKGKLKIIMANQILVEDLQGRPRIFLDATDEKAGISITMWSKDAGQICFSINDDNHGVLSIRHPNGKTGACIAVKADGQSGLELRDNNGLPSITLTSKGAEQENPEIEIQTKNRKKQLV